MAQTVATEVVRVLVHPGVAAVERVGATSITVGGALHLAALPVGLDDDSVQVGIVGPAEVRAVRVELAAVATVDAGAADAEVVAARAALAQRRAERDAVTQGLAALAALAPVEPRAELPTLPDWDAAVAARAALVELGRQRLAAGRERLAALAEELADAERAVAAAEERRARASSSTRAAGELYKVVVAIVEPRGEGGAVTVTCRYRIAGARWAPTYVARLIDGQVQLERRAVVAQATGEDWRGVALELSTAAPTRRVTLPELPALRIGRAQPTPAKAGWRPPPEGIDELYRDWDQAFARRPPTSAAPPPSMAPPPAPEPETELEASAAFDEDRKKEARFDDDGVTFAMVSAPAAAPAAPPQRAKARMSAAPKGGPLGGLLRAGGGGAAAPPLPPAPPPALEVGDELLAYGELVLGGPGEVDRGRLRRQVVADDRARDLAQRRQTALAALPAPKTVTEPAPGQYDYAFPAAGAVDVPADGGWHAIALSSEATPAAVRHLVVPAVAVEVYRVATAANPFDAPLLAGPIDVYDRDELILTAPLAETPPGGTVTVGLGVDPEVKVARNLRFREEAAGVLRGSLRLHHELTIDVDHRGARAIDLEVRERLPIPAADTDDVEVALDEVVPPWEPWRPEPAPGAAPLRGGHRWRVTVAAGERTTLRLSYAVKIAAKHELIGGNRRDA